VVVAYTTLAALQLREMSRATKASSEASHTAASALAENTRQFNITFGEMQAQTTATQKAANAAKDQAVASKDAAATALAAERGWIKITEPKAVGDAFWPPDGSFQLTVKYRLINVGHSVVTDIHVRGQFIAEWGGAVVNTIQTEISYCDEARKEHSDPKIVRTLFPGDDFWDDITLSLSKQEMEIADKTWPFGGNREKSVYPVLIGCVNYQLPFSKEIHQTRFIYDINWFRPPKPEPWNLHGRGTFPLGRAVPESEIDIRPHFLGGLFAD
jgi:hypothetical protein